MLNQEFNCQNICKQESRKIANIHFFPSKIVNFGNVPRKNQARQQLPEKAQSRSRQEFRHRKALDQEFQASLTLLWLYVTFYCYLKMILI
jgi:hypothetical protein